MSARGSQKGDGEEAVEISKLLISQEKQRADLEARQCNEINKFHTWVEEEILAVCRMDTPQQATQGQQAKEKSVCEYLLNKRYGKETLINREKDDVPGNSEIVKQLLLENRVLYNRQRHEAEALQLQQYMDLLATDPQHEQVRVRSHFPIVQVSEHSLEEFVPPF